MIIIQEKIKNLLKQKNEILNDNETLLIKNFFNTEIQRNNEKELLKEIINLYLENKHEFSKKSSQTFIHEFGHLYEAIYNDFKFTFISIIDKEKNYHHLFYKKNNKIKYSKLESNPVKDLNGIAWFYTPVELSVENWINTALGGLKNDLSLNNKSFFNSLNSFGFNLSLISLLTIILGRVTFKERKNSDLDLIIKFSSDKSYVKTLNDDFCAINNYLYDTSEDIILPSNKTAKKFPLAEYKKIIQES